MTNKFDGNLWKWLLQNVLGKLLPDTTEASAGDVATVAEDGSVEWASPAEPPEVRVVPTGGTTGQVLTAGSDNAYGWADVSQVPAGGTQGQVLTKGASGYGWAAAPAPAGVEVYVDDTANWYSGTSGTTAIDPGVSYFAQGANRAAAIPEGVKRVEFCGHIKTGSGTPTYEYFKVLCPMLDTPSGNVFFATGVETRLTSTGQTTSGARLLYISAVGQAVSTHLPVVNLYIRQATWTGTDYKDFTLNSVSDATNFVLDAIVLVY